MGTAALLAAVVLEGAITGYRVVTRSNQRRLSSALRIGALVALLLAVATPLIDWGWRWYGSGALLLVWAALAMRALLGAHLPGQPAARPGAFRARRAVAAMAARLALITLALSPVLVFPPYTHLPATGPHAVERVRDAGIDTGRVETYRPGSGDRRLTVEIWYPGPDASDPATGVFPLVVFSPGTFGTRTSNESLYADLASHGYVVAAIDHPYHAFVTTGANGHRTWIDVGFLRDVLGEDAHADKQRSLALYQGWMEIRIGDINAVIDHILAEARSPGAGPAYQRIDAAKVAVMGHSLGGSAALGVGRTRAGIGAVVALEAPFLADIEGVEADRFVFNAEPYPAPVLNVYSDTSWRHLCDWPQYAENCALLGSTGGTAHTLHIGGAGHFTLTDLALASPALTRALNRHPSTASPEDCLRTLNQGVLAFLDAYLKGGE